ncbi:SDR family oxidoreductase [Novosphingobium resinovorum]|jgi:NAD(P)-dependent dehydrogenase (short-subunit alcohol dehydrogenase family)|uniref:Oxidoreductase n=1 Tax=Novosphingobium resinovorum TaxID=158500 RepID=A0A031JW56_9SPHN|nr:MULTISPECIES: SDR family oxidoreductase [Sphingomonadaceae]AOR79457.1 oxidoreductase [Novosphingobium resinovorum]EJU11150.1 short-chain dehydrogenase/reductase SDR [Sphingomonas sp. LH128]EZP80607.1 Short-chain dehydrogenase/reductase SDR [Novosphingobium resinovorum]MBF7013628.1 SDR family oxidoreductase [Novosphingobium sp. HR1a]WJM25777.1 SDR family oxidoreductase [Novosphingobium resinovorum]
MDLKLTGKSALVTGSTAGIGLAIAERLAAEGVDVVISGRNQAKLDEAAAKVGAAAANGGKVRAVLADPATAEGAETLIAAVPQADILVNNLGIYEAKPFTEITDADWHHFFEVNVVSGARLARHYFPKMLKQDWGRVIFIASESALVIPGEMIHYGMTKTAQLAIARGLAEQTRGTGVTVNSVMPGPTRSEGIVEFIRSVVDNKDAPEAEREAEFFAKLRPLSLIRRLIEADEIAAQVALLASPLGAITNGAAIRVEGGIVPTIA